VLDALIEKIIGADSRADLTTACRAFDRVFRAGRYWVPQWYRTNHPLAYWDVFDHPNKLPRYQIDNYSSSLGERTLWWYDAARAARLEQAK
jgi:microcin C transport system substrate-binding protein